MPHGAAGGAAGARVCVSGGRVCVCCTAAEEASGRKEGTGLGTRGADSSRAACRLTHQPESDSKSLRRNKFILGEVVFCLFFVLLSWLESLEVLDGLPCCRHRRCVIVVLLVAVVAGRGGRGITCVHK